MRTCRSVWFSRSVCPERQTSAIRAMFTYDDTPLFPCRDLYAGLDLPVWIVATEGSFEPANRADIEALERRYANVRVRFLPGDHYPQHSNPMELARMIDEILALLGAGCASQVSTGRVGPAA